MSSSRGMIMWALFLGVCSVGLAGTAQDKQIPASAPKTVTPPNSSHPASKTGGAAWAAGKWIGSYFNTLGNTAPTTLIISEDGTTISGDWKNTSAVVVVNDPKHGRALRWTQVDPTYGTYQILFWISADGSGHLDYQVTGPRNYSGHVHNFVRQK